MKEKNKKKNESVRELKWSFALVNGVIAILASISAYILYAIGIHLPNGFVDVIWVNIFSSIAYTIGKNGSDIVSKIVDLKSNQQDRI